MKRSVCPGQGETIEKTSSVDPGPAPIFIVGTGRSGTTLLRLILNAHPRIYLTHEAGFYLGSQFVPKRATGLDWLECYFRSFFFRNLRADENLIRQELVKIGGTTAFRSNRANPFRAIMRTVARQFGKCRYGDKTPLHGNYLKQIFEDFPDAKVLHIVRDPRSTVYSLCKMPWASSSLIVNAWYVRRQLEAIGKYRNRIHEIRLEDLAEKPEDTIRKILAFLGEPWDFAVLSHYRTVKEIDMPPYPWLVDSAGPIGTPDPVWQQEAGPFWIRFIEKMNKPFFRRYGYPLSQPEHKVSRQDIKMLVLDLAEALRFIFRFVRLVRKTAGRYPAEPKEVESLLMSLNPNAKYTIKQEDLTISACR